MNQKLGKRRRGGATSSTKTISVNRGSGTGKHRINNIDDLSVSTDGSFATLTLYTDTAKPFPVEIETNRLDEFLLSLVSLAREAGRIKNMPDQYPSGDAVQGVIPIPDCRIGVGMSATAGKVCLVFRMGTMDLAFEVDPRELESVGRILTQQGILAGFEPPTVQ